MEGAMVTRVFIFLTGLLLAPPGFAASFDCAKADSADEVAICANPELSNRDMVIADIYRRAVDVAGSRAAQAVARQGLKERAACESDVSCIADVQQEVLYNLGQLMERSGGGTRPGLTIAYGSRAGMQVTVRKVRGLGTAHAVIEVEHTRRDATAFCRDYVLKVTPKCIEDEMKVPLGRLISANCISGEFDTLNGRSLTFKGISKVENMADYELVEKDTGEALDGSMASGYNVALEQFLALCPNRR
jgi:uncharacterized protein